MTTDTQPLTAWEIEIADSLLVDVDLNRDVPCAWLIPCDTPATWLLVNQCCAFENPHCAEHRTENDRRMAARRASKRYLQCRKCKTLNPGFQWRPL